MNNNRIARFGDDLVQVICKDKEPWFLVEDLGRVLELTNIGKRMKSIPEEEKSKCHATVSLGAFERQRRIMSVVSEAGMYRLVFMSRTETAEKFKTWVFQEMLFPKRKTKRYISKKDTFVFKMLGPTKNSEPGLMKKRFRPLEWIEGGDENAARGLYEESVKQTAN